MKSEIKYLVLSDIHLGHSINKTEYITKNLRNYFITNDKLFSKLDIIFIAGDIFDKLLITSSKDFILSIEWLTDLILYCKKNNIILRILEGTPSHDWKQAKVITSILKKLDIKIDYKYIDTLYIEKNDKLGINILYIPDEWKHKASDTYKDVKSLLEEQKLNMVDICIMHGQFHYQLPMVRLDTSHTENNYLDIVKYYISVGHIHTHSIYERILAQGSFDRLAHNEEEDKGGIYIIIKNNGDKEFRFIKNKNSMIFKTFRFSSKDTIEDVIDKLDSKIKNYPKYSNIRIITDNEDLLVKNVKDIKHRYPYFNIKIEKAKLKKESAEYRLLDTNKRLECFTIDKNNIETLMLEELKKDKITEKELTIFKEELQTIVSAI